MSKRDGDSAFPRTLGHSEGMSLRDYFAGQALAGLLGSSEFMQGIPVVAKINNLDCNAAIALDAYEIADAMIEARTNNGGKE